MNQKFVITGTGTDIGKTVFASALTSALGAYYWKPVQAGLDDGTDSETVARLGNIAPEFILPETFRLNTPASPHYAAAIDGVSIKLADLSPPPINGALIIEGAGGALVPVNDNLLYADVFAAWQILAIIVASTQLGTINHSLMTIESLRSRDVPIHGIAFIGPQVTDSEDIICQLGMVKHLGRLPIIENLSADTLRQAFDDGFSMADFT